MTSVQRRDWLLLAGHHFAFDGLGMGVGTRGRFPPVTLQPAPDYSSLNAHAQSRVGALRRVLRPADPVAPSVVVPPSDTFVTAEASLSGRGVTASLARATAAAISARNAATGKALRRIGISVAVGGVGGAGATYRRVDVSTVDEVEPAIQAALGDPGQFHRNLKGLPPGAFLLQPVFRRLSDTVLVSNLGRLDLPQVRSLEFYPVARGRSAVAVGAAGSHGGATTLTLRSGNLSQSDAEALLSRVVADLRVRSGCLRRDDDTEPVG